MSVFMYYVVPVIGLIVSYGVFFSPVHEVWQVYKTQELGHFDLLPHAFMVIQSVGWIVFARGLPSPTRYYEFFSNIMGVCTGSVACAVGYPLASKAIKVQIMVAFQVMILLYLPLVFILESTVSLSARQHTLGAIAVVVQLAFYFSPLRQTYQIIKTRDARSISYPLAVASLISTFLWAIYGSFVREAAIAVPNWFSAIFSTIQIILYKRYPIRHDFGQPDPEPPVSAKTADAINDLSIPNDAGKEQRNL